MSPAVEVERQERSQSDVTGYEMQEDGKTHLVKRRQNEDLHERSGGDVCEILNEDGVLCCDTERLSVPCFPDNTHRHTVKHVVWQFFPPSISANEFKD